MGGLWGGCGGLWARGDVNGGWVTRGRMLGLVSGGKVGTVEAWELRVEGGSEGNFGEEDRLRELMYIHNAITTILLCNTIYL